MMKFIVPVLFILFGIQTADAEPMPGDFTAAHPGGNGILSRGCYPSPDIISVEQNLTGTRGWWFYWNFMVSNVPRVPLTYEFQNGNVIGTRGPAASIDGGKTWTWLGRDCVSEKDGKVRFTYEFKDGQDAAIFAFAPAYVESDLDRFLAKTGDHPNLRVSELCQSNGGRTVERIHVGQLEGQPAHRIFVTARHHACESMASYVLEGLLAAVLADSETGAWFRENVELLAVPFVDKDGVENGDQGKNRIPRDHGRDYAGEALYNSTRTIRDVVPEWSNGGLDIALDLHCPHIRGNYNEFIYQVGQEAPEIWHAQEQFAAILESIPDAALPYRADNDLPYGEAWNTGKNYTQGMPMARWAASLPGIRLSTTFEIPYANVGEITITPDRARGFGKTLARALHLYLERSP